MNDTPTIASTFGLPPCDISVERSYEQAKVLGSEPYKGVVLHLHGCAGLNLCSDRMRGFAGHLILSGLLLVAPDSFADDRPPKSCGPPWYEKSRIYGVRAGQARHAVERIRIDYPGKPIVVWGHSEGGGVANLIDEQVAGIVTTGYHCGFRSCARTAILEDVPLLAIIGTEDPYIHDPVKGSKYGSIQSLCDHVFRVPTRRYVMVDGMGHWPDMRYTMVGEAVNAFLDRTGVI